MTYSDNIFALSTASGKAGIAVIRVSGNNLKAIFNSILPPSRLEARKLIYTSFYHPTHKELLDKGMFVYFPAPSSFTGEDCIELHIHGGSSTIQAMLSALSVLPNFRLAEPGEFTRRGFLHGKFDLTQAESIIDLIDAESDHQRRSALAQSQGVLYQLYHQWWSSLSELRAYTEACLDFADEELPDNLSERITKGLEILKTDMERHIQSANRGELLKNGTTVAIIGPSNAGKSSLLNHFTQQPTAITSSIAGTTRDSLSHHVHFHGFALKMIDTAGLQDTDDLIEQEGIRRAKQHAEIADFVLLMFDSDNLPEDLSQYIKLLEDKSSICLLNKIDLLGEIPEIEKLSSFDCCFISLEKSSGIDEFHRIFREKLHDIAGFDHTPIITHSRYQQAVNQALLGLEKALCLVQTSLDLVLIAEELRRAQNSLGEITGKADVENLLDIIFGKFCIGK